MMTEGFNYHGAKADIKVWNPYVEHDDEYSTSRIILENGAYNNYECVESGWMVCIIISTCQKLFSIL